MRVLWLTNIPSPYRLKFFSELGKHVQLTVLFEKGFSAERDETWKDYQFVNYTGIVLRGISVLTDMAISVGFKRYIDNFRKDIIVVSNPITPTGIAAILYMQRHGIQYCIESDGAFPKEKVGLRGALKQRLYSRAHLCLTTSELGKQYFLNYGVLESEIKKYPFSSVRNQDIIDPTHLQKKRQYFKEALGIEEQKMVLTVGQFIPRKGFDVLLKAAKFLSPDVGFYLIGGTPGEDYLSIIDESVKERIHFIPFLKPDKVKEYYLAADVFAFPSHEDIWGLVTNEAMAQGLPVISTDKCISALEMVHQGENGYIVEDNDIDSLAEKLQMVLSADDYMQMCEKSVDTAHHYTIETMVEKHLSIFNSIRPEK